MRESGRWRAAGGAPAALARVRARAREEMATRLPGLWTRWRVEEPPVELTNMLVALVALVAAEVAADDALAVVSHTVPAELASLPPRRRWVKRARERLDAELLQRAFLWSEYLPPELCSALVAAGAEAIAQAIGLDAFLLAQGITVEPIPPQDNVPTAEMVACPLCGKPRALPLSAPCQWCHEPKAPPQR